MMASTVACPNILMTISSVWSSLSKAGLTYLRKIFSKIAITRTAE